MPVNTTTARHRRVDLPPGSVIGGVDTHKDVHVAAAVDELGQVLGSASFATTATGYRQLSEWLSSFGPLAAVGVEGTGCWGAGLARHLSAEGIEVVEVNRPNRQRRRRRGKSDTIDAEEAARAVLAGDALAVPKAATGTVECVRQLRIARRGAVKARGQPINTMRALIDTAPE
jgi:transposase